MGQINSNGIVSGQKITRICANESCNMEYESWSDDTRTIKGMMHPCKYCEKCDAVNISKIDIDFEELVRNMRDRG